MNDTAKDTAPSSGPKTIPVDDLFGLYVTAKRDRFELHGVLLPPTPRSRSTQLRLACDDGTIARIKKPEVWTFAPHHTLARDKSGRPLATAKRVSGRPVYRFGDLPAHHLATKTMLRRDRRRQPAPGQLPVAYYDAKDLWAPLFAIVDTVELPPLPQHRAEAFTLARTCCQCTQVFERPLQKSPEGDRYCEPCHIAAVPGRWAEQIRPVQAEIAAWAASVLADPTAAIAHTAWHCSGWSGTAMHVETIGGELLLHANVRSFRDISSAAEPDKYADTVHASEILSQLEAIAGRRIITWQGLNTQTLIAYDDNGKNLAPKLDSGRDDQINERWALWSGRAPQYRSGFWFPTPKLPWNYNRGDDELLRTAADAEGKLQALRHYLKVMATEPAPEPTVPKAGR